jgi:hypothetical protein
VPTTNSNVVNWKQALWIVAALAIISCILAWRSRSFQNPLKVPILREAKLLDIQSDPSTNTFVCPEALNYVLLLAVPADGSVSAGRGGKVVLSQNGTNILELSMSSAVASANWLAKYNLDAYIVESQSTATKAEMNWYFRGGIPYEIRGEDLPKGSSIWLRYVYPSRWNMPLIGKRRHKP